MSQPTNQQLELASLLPRHFSDQRLAQFRQLLEQASNIVIIQAENPDIDSLGSALAIEDIAHQLGKKSSLYCPVQIPSYMRYLPGWDRVSDEFDYHADLAIIVDTASQILLSKVLDDPIRQDFLHSKPVIVIDHHQTKPDVSFTPALELIAPAVASAELILDLVQSLQLELSSELATALMAAILGDTLGLSTQNVSPHTYFIMSYLTEAGAHVYDIDQARFELAKKAPEILNYKGELLQRVEYEVDGKLALVTIPFEEIKLYSDKYNPSVLVLDEMRFVTGVEVAIALKTYPDGKITGKIRSNAPIAETIAGYFGGGGHANAAGFRVYDDFATIKAELIETTRKALND